MVFGSPRATETYCRDETDPIAQSGVSDFVADYEIGEKAKWRMSALGKTACGLRGHPMEPILKIVQINLGA
jgi:hypothetical protein